MRFSECKNLIPSSLPPIDSLPSSNNISNNSVVSDTLMSQCFLCLVFYVIFIEMFPCLAVQSFIFATLCVLLLLTDIHCSFMYVSISSSLIMKSIKWLNSAYTSFVDLRLWNCPLWFDQGVSEQGWTESYVFYTHRSVCLFVRFFLPVS